MESSDQTPAAASLFNYNTDRSKCEYRKDDSCKFDSVYGYCTISNCPRMKHNYITLPPTPRAKLISVFGIQYVKYFEEKAIKKEPIVPGTANKFGVKCPHCKKILLQSKFEDFFYCPCSCPVYHINYILHNLPKGLDLYL